MKSSKQLEQRVQQQKESLPETGKVHEVRREWLVREDGAFAYQLQSQEINQHLQHNKHKNAQVREDFPCALDEQLREQQLAEQAAAVYKKMLAEQEEIDNLVARELAENLEKEECLKKKQLEKKDEVVARHLYVEEIAKHPIPTRSMHPDFLRLKPLEEFSYSPNRNHYFSNLRQSNPRRQAMAMPLPANKLEIKDVYMTPKDCIELYTEPYGNKNQMADQLEYLELQDIGLPIDEFNEKRIQEERDAEFARQLQEEEGATKEFLLNRDRMLAIEARDKELAKMLQDRERAKVKRARERAKQKAQVKKQLGDQQILEANQLLPDDSYAFPADLIPHRENHFQQQGIVNNISPQKSLENLDDDSYSNPLDILHQEVRHSCSQKSYGGRFHPNGSADRMQYDNIFLPSRPTQLDLRCPQSRISKPRMPDPELCEDSTNKAQSSPLQHVNIAMAIDPTYTKKGYHNSPPIYDTTSYTVPASTSSISPAHTSPADVSENDDELSPVPPYMPIQGQRRTSSLEKKHKKKSKDSCRQQ